MSLPGPSSRSQSDNLSEISEKLQNFWKNKKSEIEELTLVIFCWFKFCWFNFWQKKIVQKEKELLVDAIILFNWLLIIKSDFYCILTELFVYRSDVTQLYHYYLNSTSFLFIS